jgi:hypothetical protein
MYLDGNWPLNYDPNSDKVYNQKLLKFTNRFFLKFKEADNLVSITFLLNESLLRSTFLGRYGDALRWRNCTLFLNFIVSETHPPSIYKHWRILLVEIIIFFVYILNSLSLLPFLNFDALFILLNDNAGYNRYYRVFLVLMFMLI